MTAARAVPAAPAASPSPAPAPATLTAASSSCGFFDVTCHITSAITGWFAGLITSAINPLVSFIGSSALSTPQPSSIPAVSSLWAASLAIADACYLLLVVIGGVIVMSHETLQSSYSAKEIAPRLVTGFIAANLSMVVMTRAVGIANGLSAALAGGGDVNQQAAARQLVTTLATSAQTDHGAFLILLELAGIILALVLAAVYVIRMMAVVLLAAAAPILLALYALPQTAWAARWYCRAGVAVLAIQAAQGLVLSAAVKVFFAPGWLPGSGGYLEQVLVTLCLLYIMMRIPFWIARPVLSPFGPSPARRAVRFAFTAAVLSRIRPVPSGTAGSGRAAGRGGTAGPGRAGGRPPGAGRAARRHRGHGARRRQRDRQHRWVQPPLPGMPSPPRRPRHQQLALFGPPPSSRQPPSPPPARPAAGGPGRRERVPAAAAARHAGPAATAAASSPSPPARRPPARPPHPHATPGRQPLMACDVTDPVPIPADVEMPDRVLAGLTARQVAIAAAAAAVLWLGWMAARHVMPLPAFAALAAPAGLAATALVLVERDGLPLDRLLAAAWRQARSPRRLVTAPEGIPGPPAWAPAAPGPRAPLPAPLPPLWLDVSPDGVISLGAHGAATVAAVSTVNFALRSPAEQDALAAAYGRWLNSPDRPGPGADPGRARRPDQRGRRPARGRPGPAAPGPGAGRAGARAVPRRAGRRAGRADPAGAAGHPRARPRRHPRRGRHRRRAGGAARRGGRPAAGRRRPAGPGPGRRAGHRAAGRLRRPVRPAAARRAARPARRARHQPGQARMTRRARRQARQAAAWDMPGPAAVEVAARHVRAGDDWAATLAVTGYPAEVSPGWLEPLLSYPGRLDVTLHIEPIPTAVAAARLRRQRARLESGRRHGADRGRLDDPDTESAAADARELAYRLARGEGKLFRLGLYLTIHAGSEDELAAEIQAVRALAASLLLVTVPATFRSLQGWATTLPAGTDQLMLRRTMDTAALAASFPFTSPDLPRDPASPDALPGVLYGVNTAGPGLVAWDRWAQPNHNSVTLAASGAGKSYLAKLEILRSLYQGTECWVIDPEDEYARLARAVGGAYVHLGAPGVHLNPFDLPAAGRARPDTADPPRPVHPHRHRGPARLPAAARRAGRPRPGDHDRLPAGRDHRRPPHLGAARAAAARPGARAARGEDPGRHRAGRPADPVHRGHPLRAVRRADHHPPRGPPRGLLAAGRARRAAPGRDPARPGRHLAQGLRPRPAPPPADHRR